MESDRVINRRQFLAKVAAAGAATTIANNNSSAQDTSAAPPISPARAGSPNILVFMPDQQNGATVLPGSPVIKPHMDAFLKQAIAFRSAHCPAPHCCPSRTSFLSGMYPSEHGVFNNVSTETAIHFNPYPGTPFWGRWLRAAGYQMGYAGKLHVGADIKPEDLGFDNLSRLEQDNLVINNSRKPQQWQQGHEQLNPSPAARKPGEILRAGWGSDTLYATLPDESFAPSPDVRIVQAGASAITKFAAAGKPWCLMISNSGAHDPYTAPKRYVDMYDLAKVVLPPSFKDTLDDKPRIYQRQRYQHWSQLSDEETRESIRHYYARCTMQDELFGTLLDALEKSGQADNTIVLYVSDHGDYLGAHGLWMKGIPAFNEAYHIPWVMRWPKGIAKPGRTVDHFVDQADFGPTILEAAGITPPQNLSGKSLMPFFRGEVPADWRSAYCTQNNGVELYYTQRAITMKDWKYVYNGFDYDELYHLATDPHETKNLAFPDLTKKRAEVLAGLGLAKDAHLPWPPLDGEAAAARKQLLEQMWTFAADHHDTIFNKYGTVAMAPYGPGLGPDPGGETYHR